jgi:hypothetical protein
MSSFRFDPDNELDDEEKVTLTDEEGRLLDCYVENSLESEDNSYFLLMPVDTPVVILAWEEEDEESDLSDAIIIEDSDEIDRIFADAKAVLAELDLALKNTAYTLTASGELPPLEDNEVIALEIDSEEEELQFLASFYSQDQKYSIYTPLSPLLFLAKYGEKGELELVSPDDTQMQPILEELLFEEMDE